MSPPSHSGRTNAHKAISHRPGVRFIARSHVRPGDRRHSFYAGRSRRISAHFSSPISEPPSKEAGCGARSDAGHSGKRKSRNCPGGPRAEALQPYSGWLGVSRGPLGSPPRVLGCAEFRRGWSAFPAGRQKWSEGKHGFSRMAAIPASTPMSSSMSTRIRHHCRGRRSVPFGEAAFGGRYKAVGHGETLSAHIIPRSRLVGIRRGSESHVGVSGALASH
jgi:hypothetical protein